MFWTMLNAVLGGMLVATGVGGVAAAVGMLAVGVVCDAVIFAAKGDEDRDEELEDLLSRCD